MPSADPTPDYDLHPLCAAFPRIEGEDFATLCRDISAHGLREPITLYEGQILDGGNRYRACRAVGVAPRFRNFDGSYDDLRDFVLSVNNNRRHQSAGQRAMVVAHLTTLHERMRPGRPHPPKVKEEPGSALKTEESKEEPGSALKTGKVKEEPSSALPTAPAKEPEKQKTSVADRAKESGVTPRFQRMAESVAAADPELSKEVIAGRVSLKKADRKVRGKDAPAPAPAPDAPAPAAKPVDPEREEKAQKTIARLKLKVEEQQAEIEELQSLVTNAEDAAEQAVATAANLQSIADGEEAKRMAELAQKLQISENSKNGLMNENAQLKRQIKMMQRTEAKLKEELDSLKKKG